MEQCAWNHYTRIARNEEEIRVMRHSEIYKFCDATLNRVLEGLRSYNNDVKYGYIQRDLTNEEVKYMKLFEEVIEKHGLDECVSMSTPMETKRLDADLQGTPTDQTTYRRMIGGLMYLTASHPDIAFGYFISKKQDCTAMSTVEAEYVSLSACCAQVIWMRTQLLDYGYKYNRILMYFDSNSAIAISCNPVQHSKIKHIDIRYHFIKEHVEKGTMELYFVGTEYQLADLFTKALLKERFEY
ncbi:hypothetical protein Tco_0869618 [Tanacetum coccineum]